MKKIIRIIGFLIVLCLPLTPFSGCSADRYAVTSPNANSENTETVKSVEAGNVESGNWYSYHGVEISPETLIMTVDSSPVYWPEFHFWLNYIEKYYRNYHPDAITNWDAGQKGMTLNEFFFSCAVGYACKDRAIENRTKELGIELSVHDLAEMEKKRKSNIEIYGSESEYLRIVGSMYFSEDVFNYLSKIDCLGNYMFQYFYGANGEKCSDQDVYACIEKQGYKCAKYIFLSNSDSDGKALSAEACAENYKLLENILGQLRGSNDPLTLFDALMDKHGKEMTASNYPDGRLFVSGGVEEGFEKAFLQLKENEFSGIVKTGQGYYIILRMPISPDMRVDSSGNTLRYSTAYDYMFKKQVEDLAAKMEIKYEDVYYELISKDFSGD